jgi:hypothetical protein
MLSVNSYSQAYINECRLLLDGQILAYNDLVIIARKLAEGHVAQLNHALDVFASHYFNHLVLALDHYFLHRDRMQELKDGNPLNEVRMLSSSILEHQGFLAADKTIHYTPSKSILKYKLGDPIKLTEDDFMKLYHAYMEEIENKFSE